MKAPVLERFDTTKSKSTFAGKVKAKAEEQQKVVKQTFSISQQDADYIHATALDMGEAIGKPVSASKALRAIIDTARGQK